MDKEIEEHVKYCHPCQLVAQPPHPEPMNPTELPKECWTDLAIDICGPFPTGEYIVVLTDYHSRWPEAKILNTVTSATILKWLNSIFAQHGYPKVLKSDNASYFTSAEFKTTLQSWSIEHKTVTEYWPQANGQVERFNQLIKKHVLTAQAERKDWRDSLPNLLLHYRTTPHRITGQTPAKLLMKRELRTKIPAIPQIDEETDLDEEVRRKDESEKAKAKAYTDKKRHATERHLAVGDKVLVRQKRKNKYSTKFCKDPMTVEKINGSQIILRDQHGNQHRRNSSHVKKYWTKTDSEEEEEQPTTKHPQDNPITRGTPPEDNSDQPIIQPEQPPLRRSTRERSIPDRLGYETFRKK